jgi:6-phosphofructokinase 1
LAAGVEFVIVPEVKTKFETICKELCRARELGKRSLIIVFAEGAGNAHDFTMRIEKCTGYETRLSSLGYIQRGGSPSGRSRILACQFGSRAVKLLINGEKKGRLVVMRRGEISDIAIADAMRGKKKLDSSLLALAHRLAK